MAGRWISKVLNQPSIEDTSHYTKENRQRSSLMAILIGTFSALGGFLYGYDTGIINSLLSMTFVKHTFSANGESFTASETSVITAILSAGTFVGALLAPLLSDTVGRRMTIIMITAVVFPVGTALQVAATGIPLLCVGRFVSGLAVGIISAVVPVYQSEASPKWIRGSVVSTYQWAITWGLLVSSAVSQGTHSIDDFRSYRIPIALQMIWTYILAAGMYLLPESPRFFVKRNNLDKALTSLSRLRKLPPTNDDLIEELVEIKAQHDYEASFGEAKLLDCFRSSPSRHSQLLRMLTGMGLQCLQQSTGINFIFYYGVNFFVKSGLSHSYIMSLITYTVNVAATIPGILSVEVIGRRKLLLIGAVGMTISNLIIGIVGSTTDSKVANQVMIAFVCVFIAFFASTWGPIVWVICSEVYSLDIRGKAVSITASMNWIVNFAFAFLTPYLVDTGNHTASLGTNIFFIWGGCCFAGLIFSYLCVYETKGLMLEEVDEMYRCCKFASKSSSYKSKIHERYMNNELGVLNNDSEDSKNIEMQPADLKSQTDSSASPTNTTVDNTSLGRKGQQKAHQIPDSADRELMGSLNLANQTGFAPDLDFSRFGGADLGNTNSHNSNHADNMYHLGIGDRSPPSLDSASFYNTNSSSSSDDDGDDDGGSSGNGSGSGNYNYINEADLMNFISGLNKDPAVFHQSNNINSISSNSSNNNNNVIDTGGSSTSASDTLKRGSISSSSKTVQSSASLSNYTFKNNPITETKDVDQSGGNGSRLVDYNDILTGLKLTSIQPPNARSSTGGQDQGTETTEPNGDEDLDDYEDDDDDDDDSFLNEIYD